MSVLDKMLDMFHMADEDDDYGDPYEAEKPKAKDKAETPKNNVARLSDSVKPMAPKPRKTFSAIEVCTIKPNSFEDATEIMDTLMSGRPVILNVEGLNVDIAQRIIDICCGATYSIKGNFQKVSNFIFILTPNNVDVSGDLQTDVLGNIGYSVNESVSTSGFGTTSSMNSFTSGLR